MFSDCCQTQDEEPLPWPIFIHADNTAQWHEYADPQSALLFEYYIRIFISTYEYSSIDGDY